MEINAKTQIRLKMRLCHMYVPSLFCSFVFFLDRSKLEQLMVERNSSSYAMKEIA